MITFQRQNATGLKCVFVVVAITLASLSAARSDTQDTVRVAAVQCYSEMGSTATNVANLASLIRQAAHAGAKIVVTPECGVQGYLYPPTWKAWTLETNTVPRSVWRVAETVPGAATRAFSRLAKELGLHLCVGLIESAGEKFYNAQVLIGPDGTIVAHHRKKALWTPGDSPWCTSGDLPVQVVDSPYGRIGLMICYDYNALPKLLAERKADIVLYSVGWYGPNEADWFRRQFPRRFVVPFGFHVVAANWSGATDQDEWPGRGCSCVIKSDGTVLAMAKTVVGTEIVIADLPVTRRPKTQTSAPIR